MAKWHVNPKTGDAGSCRASTTESCPFGAAYHGTSREECERIFAEDMLGEKTFSTHDVASGRPRQGVVKLKPDLTADQRRESVASLVILGHKVPPMSFAAGGPMSLENIETSGNPATTTVPSRGLWLSRTKPGGSDWTPSMEEYRNSIGPVVSIQSVEPTASARILKIDSYEDLASAMAAYPGSESGWHGKALDIELLKEDGFDGIYLTRKGFLETRPHPENEKEMYYSPGQEHRRAEISAQRVNTHGWVPSMVLFSKEAVGKVGPARKAHRAGTGKSVELMLIGEHSAAAKFASLKDFIKAQNDGKLLSLIVKYRRKKRLSSEQTLALESFEAAVLSRGLSREHLDQHCAAAEMAFYLKSSERAMQVETWRRLDAMTPSGKETSIESWAQVSHQVQAEFEAEFEAAYKSREAKAK